MGRVVTAPAIELTPEEAKAFEEGAKAISRDGGSPEAFFMPVESGIALRMQGTGDTREQAFEWAKNFVVQDEDGYVYLCLTAVTG